MTLPLDDTFSSILNVGSAKFIRFHGLLLCHGNVIIFATLEPNLMMQTVFAWRSNWKKERISKHQFQDHSHSLLKLPNYFYTFRHESTKTEFYCHIQSATARSTLLTICKQAVLRCSVGCGRQDFSCSQKCSKRCQHLFWGYVCWKPWRIEKRDRHHSWHFSADPRKAAAVHLHR